MGLRVLSSEVTLVEGEPARAGADGALEFAFDVMVSGVRLAGVQFLNCACSAVRVDQDQGGEWIPLLPWTPLLMHDYRDAVELEAWHYIPITMVRLQQGSYTCAHCSRVRRRQFAATFRPEPMARLRFHVQYRAQPGIPVHQLRHVRCLRLARAGPEDAEERAASAADALDKVDDVCPPSTMVATRALLLSEVLAERARGTRVV